MSEAIKWASYSDLPLWLQFEEGYVPSELYIDDIFYDFREAYAKWSAVENGCVSFTEEDPDENVFGDRIQINFSSTSGVFAGSPAGVEYTGAVTALCVYNNQFVVSSSEPQTANSYASILYNNSSGRMFIWGRNIFIQGFVNFTHVTLHELGHLLGLNHCTASGDPVMADVIYLNGVIPRAELTTADEQGIQNLCASVTGVEDNIWIEKNLEIWNVGTSCNSCAIPHFIDNWPYGDYIQDWGNWEINASSTCGEVLIFQAPAGGLITIPELPIGYYWNRDANGNVIAELSVTGIDNDGETHSASTSIKIGNVPNTFTTSGTLSSSTTWCGEVILSGTITVPVGITLTIQPGTIIKFPTSASLIVEGNLTASICKFTSQSGTTNSSWGTITFSGSGAAGSSIYYSSIQYATRIEAINTSNITISNCNIDTCYDAVDFYNSSGSILNNSITSNSVGHGIIIEQGSFVACRENIITKTYSTRRGTGILVRGGAGGLIARNDIYHWDWGIGAIWGSSPTSNTSYSNERNNRVRDCNTGLMVYRLSYPIFGIPIQSENYNLNSISSNTYNARIGTTYPDYESRLFAYNNWWGSNPPNTSLFQVGSLSQFYYNPYLYSDPWSGFAKVVADNNESSDNETKMNKVSANDEELVLYGDELRRQEKYNEAKDYFISYINKNSNSQAAYIQLYNCYNEETGKDIIKFFENLPEKAFKDHKLLLSSLYLKESDFKAAKEVNNSLIDENPRTELATQAKLNNIYISLYNGHNIDEAITSFNEVMKNSELSTLVELSLAHNAIETYGITYGKETNGLSALPDYESFDEELNKQDGTEKLEIPDQYTLLGNYPNPFNPSTTISYSLPYLSSVELIIYDIMGREIKSFNISSQAAGYNKLVWDGKNQYGNSVTSGVYFYRVNIKSLENEKTFVKTAKLLLLK